MSWTDPARVEKLERLLYQCLSTFTAFLDYPHKLLDQYHVQFARDELKSKMKSLDLPEYGDWKWLEGKGHTDWTCINVTPYAGKFLCSKCGCTFDTEDEDLIEPRFWVDGVAAYPSYCPNCGRKVVEE